MPMLYQWAETLIMAILIYGRSFIAKHHNHNRVIIEILALYKMKTKRESSD